MNKPINIDYNKDKMAIFKAIKAKDTEAISLLLKENPNVLTERNVHTFTPLHFACSQGFFEITELLLKAGADVNALCNNKQALHIILTKKYNEKFVKLLLDYGADINFEDKTLQILENTKDKSYVQSVTDILSEEFHKAQEKLKKIKKELAQMNTDKEMLITYTLQKFKSIEILK